MSMDITSNYNAYEGAYAAQKKATKNTEGKESHIITSTVELKTSTPGKTRTEQIKTGYSNVDDYSKYLQGKYSYMNTGTSSMQGVPTTVSVSSAFLKKCMNDPEKAKYLEENLAAIPGCAAKAVAGCYGTLTNLSYKVDANGNISVAISGTNDPDGRIARENAKRKANEQKEKADRLEKKRTEEKEQEERLAKIRAEKKAKIEALQSREVTVTGSDIWNLTEKMAEAISHSDNATLSETAGLDFKI